MQTKSATADLRLPIPSASKGIWSWLQPYPDADAAGGRHYNALDVGEDGKIFRPTVLWRFRKVELRDWVSRC
jgi:hypothetical protein